MRGVVVGPSYTLDVQATDPSLDGFRFHEVIIIIIPQSVDFESSKEELTLDWNDLIGKALRCQARPSLRSEKLQARWKPLLASKKQAAML
jgi:hypothetical protein